MQLSDVNLKEKEAENMSQNYKENKAFVEENKAFVQFLNWSSYQPYGEHSSFSFLLFYHPLAPYRCCYLRICYLSRSAEVQRKKKLFPVQCSVRLVLEMSI